MNDPGSPRPDWTVVDQGWGRRAVDFATLSELANCREYVALHHKLGVDAVSASSTWPAGADWPSSWRICAAPTVPESMRRGDSSRWPGTVTRLRTSVWATCTAALGGGELRRRDQLPRRLGHHGGAVAESTGCCSPAAGSASPSGDISKPPPGSWALAPFLLADTPRSRTRPPWWHRADRCRGGTAARYGFIDIERVDVPFVWEFADPETYARAHLIDRAGV